MSLVIKLFIFLSVLQQRLQCNLSLFFFFEKFSWIFLEISFPKGHVSVSHSFQLFEFFPKPPNTHITVLALTLIIHSRWLSCIPASTALGVSQLILLCCCGWGQTDFSGLPACYYCSPSEAWGQFNISKRRLLAYFAQIEVTYTVTSLPTTPSREGIW